MSPQLNPQGWTQTDAKREWTGDILGITVRVYKYTHWTSWFAIGKLNEGTIDEIIRGGEGKTPEAAVEQLVSSFYTKLTPED